MNENKSTSLTDMAPMITGGIFAFLAAWQLIKVIRNFWFLGLVWLVAYLLVAVSAFMKRKDIMPVVGLGLLAVLSLYGFLIGFAHGTYSTFSWSDWEEHFNLFTVIPALFRTASYAAAAVVAAAALTNYLPSLKDMVKKLWFAPAALAAVSSVFGIFLTLVFKLFDGFWPASASYASFGNIFHTLVLIAGFLFVGFWAVGAEGLPQAALDAVASVTSSSSATNAAGNDVAAPTKPYDSDAYCSLVKHILLLLFTFGIWNLIWIYRMTGYLNKAKNEPPRTPTNQLLLCLFVPFYSIFWTYKSAQRVDVLAKERGIPSDLATLCVILAIFIGILPPILMQDKVNSICTAEGKGPAPAAQPQPAAVLATPVAAPAEAPVEKVEEPAPAPAADPADELKKYKALLDEGVITQEDFDAKKKQLLGL